MIKFIKEKIKEWKFNRELKRLVRLPVLVIETTTYIEEKPFKNVKKSHNVMGKSQKTVKNQKKAKKNVKKHR